MSALTSQQKTALRKGRERATRQRRRDAIRRVARYQAWLKAGSNLRSIPEIPSDADYRIARGR